jgi:hypothetical protein
VQSSNSHPALNGIGIFFLLKDKKYEEALKLVEQPTDQFSIFLKSQVYLANKQPKEAFENLAVNFEDSLTLNSGYVKFLLESAIQFKTTLRPTMEKLVSCLVPKVASLDC